MVPEVLLWIKNIDLGYDEWIIVLAAIKQTLGVPGDLDALDEKARDMVLDWNLTYPGNDEAGVREKWSSITETGVGLNWLRDKSASGGMPGSDQIEAARSSAVRDFSDDPGPGTAEGSSAGGISETMKRELADLGFDPGKVNTSPAGPRGMEEQQEGRAFREADKWGFKGVREWGKNPIIDGNWLIKGVLPMSGFGVIYGAPGCGKSFLATEMGLRIAAGGTWLGQKIKDPGLVIYIASEGGVEGLTNRMAAWRLRFGDLPRGMLAAPVTLDLRSNEDDARALVAMAKRVSREMGLPVRGVFVDTLNRNMGGGNENAPDDMSKFIARCEWVRVALGCFVLVVHHSGKDEARGMRGHSALLGAVDVELEVVREPGTVGRIGLTKSRASQDGQAWGFELDVVDLGRDQDNDMVTSCVVVARAAPARKRDRYVPVGVALEIWEAIQLVEIGPFAGGKTGLDWDIVWAKMASKMTFKTRDDEKYAKRNYKRAVIKLADGKLITFDPKNANEIKVL